MYGADTFISFLVGWAGAMQDFFIPFLNNIVIVIQKKYLQIYPFWSRQREWRDCTTLSRHMR